MILVLAVAIQSTKKANGQLIQRGVIHQTWDLPDDETFKDAFLLVGAQGEGESGKYKPLIQK